MNRNKIFYFVYLLSLKNLYHMISDIWSGAFRNRQQCKLSSSTIVEHTYGFELRQIARTQPRVAEEIL